MKFRFLPLLLALLPLVLHAQSVPNGTISIGQVWTTAQWNAAWQAKADAASGILTTPSLISPILSGTYSLAPVTVSAVSNLNATSCTFTPSAGCQGFGWIGNVSGTYTSQTYAANQIVVGGDSLANTSSSNQLVSALEVDHAFGGTFQGLAEGEQITLVMTAATANATPGTAQYSVLGLTGQLNTSDGGTLGTPQGSLYGFNPNVRILGAVQHANVLNGGEIDIGAYTGSTLAKKYGLTIVQTNLDAVQGNLANNAIAISNQSGASGWNIGYGFGTYDGFWPMSSTGTLVGCEAHANSGSCGTTANGIDFGNVVFTSKFLNSIGFSVDGSGNIVAAQLIDTKPTTFGFGAQAVGASFVTNSTHPPGVMGTFGTPSAQASYPTRDSVGVYMDNTAPAPIANQAGTFSTTQFFPTVPFTAPQLAQFVVGMNVLTNDTTFYSGIVTSWATNGTSLTVSGWFQQGNTAAGQTPAGSVAIVNATTKIWVQNGNCLYPASGSIATACAGYEMGLQDLSATATTNTNWMYDAINLTATFSPNNVAYIARGAWGYGFNCSLSTDTACFLINAPGGIGILSNMTSGNVIQAAGILTSGFYFQSSVFNVAFNGQTDIGSKTATSSSPLVLHSSGHAGADAFFQVSGGTGFSDGVLSIGAGSINSSLLWTGAQTFTPTAGTALTINVPSSGLGVAFALPGSGASNAFVISNTSGNQAGFALQGDGLTGGNAFTISQNASGQAVLAQGNSAAMILQTAGINRFIINGDGGINTAGLTDEGIGTLNATAVYSSNTKLFPTLTGTTGSIGGGALTAGACTSGTVAVTSSTTAMAVSVSPVADPGTSITWQGFVSAAGTVTVRVCALVAATPTATAYNVRVLQ